MVDNITSALFAVLVFLGQACFPESVTVLGLSRASYPSVVNPDKSNLMVNLSDHGNTILIYDFQYLSALLKPEELSDLLLQSSTATAIQQVKQAK